MQLRTDTDELNSKKKTTDTSIANIEMLVNVDYAKIVNRMKNSLTADIYRWKGESDDHYSMRVLGRIRYHVSEKGHHTAEDVNITTVYDDLHKKFMGLGKFIKS